MSANLIAPLDPTFVLEGIKDFFKKWYESFASVYEQQNGYTPRWFVMPAKWETMSEFKQWSDNELPHVVVVCPGWLDEPQRHGNGQTDVTLMVTLVCVCGSNERVTSHSLAMGYGQILAWIGDEAADAETDFIREIKLLDVDYTDVEGNASVASAAVSFAVEVSAYLTGLGGPPLLEDDPPDDPYTGPPEDFPAPPNTTQLEVIKVTEIS